MHIELFAANRVVLVARAIGTRPPRGFAAGRLSRAGCYGDLVTIDPTGLILVRPNARLKLSDLFRAWGQPLTRTRLASFAAQPDQRVVAFVDGLRWRGSPMSIPLTRHSEVVVEIGPYVPPHRSYAFPPGT
jgi:hypothetical protein